MRASRTPVWALVLIPAAACGADLALTDQPTANADKTDAITIHGIVPQDIAVKLYVTWQTTGDSGGCMASITAVGSNPRVFKFSVDPIRVPRATNQWLVWRDAFTPGRCGWILKSIDVFADSADSGRSVDRATNLPNRIAYVLSPGEEHDSYSWAENDDNKIPVRLFCKFSPLHKLDQIISDHIQSSINPCALGWEKYHGTDAGKKEHILIQSHHDILFTIDDYR